MRAEIPSCNCKYATVEMNSAYEPSLLQVSSSVIVPKYAEAKTAPEDVHYSVFGNRAEDTVVDANGLLHISPRESAKLIQARATSAYDGVSFDTVSVALRRNNTNGVEILSCAQRVRTGHAKF
jgi:hypothetical protein